MTKKKSTRKTSSKPERNASPPPAAGKTRNPAPDPAMPAPDRAPQNGAAVPRRPFGSAFRWNVANALMMTSNDGLVTAAIEQEPAGRWDLTVRVRNWMSVEDAQNIFYILAAVLLDDDGYLLRYDEFNFDILNLIGAGVIRQRKADAQRILKRANEAGILPEEYPTKLPALMQQIVAEDAANDVEPPAAEDDDDGLVAGGDDFDD